MKKLSVLKKNGNTVDFEPQKIKNAIRKSAERVCVTLTDKEEDKVVAFAKHVRV